MSRMRHPNYAGKLFARDLKMIRCSVVNIIIVLGLVLLPSLFTWFNVAASWDPFSNTTNLKFAVANTDEGYESDLVPVKINVGETIISTLRANDQLDWTFTTEADAIDGTKSGAYYAAVVIPKDFSKDMLTFFTKDAQHANLLYYTNEKKNALAPKITGQGADQVQVQVNQTFAKTIAEVAVGIVEKLSGYLDDDSTKQLVVNASGNVDKIAGQLTDASTALGMYSTLVDSAITLVDTSTTLADQSKDSAAQTKQLIADAKTNAEGIAGTLDTASSSVGTAIASTANGYQAVADSIDHTMGSVDQNAADVSASLRSQANDVSTQAQQYRDIASALQAINKDLNGDGKGELDAIIAQINAAADSIDALAASLNKAADDVDARRTASAEQRQQIKDLAASAKQSVTDLKGQYDNDLKPQLDQISSSVTAVAGDASVLGAQLETAVGTLSGSTDSVDTKLADVKKSLDKGAKSLAEAGAKLSEVSEKLSNALSGGDMEQVKQILGEDPSAFATTLSAPVALERKPVFAVANFGTAMSPLYTVLALWIGSLLMAVTIKSEVSRKVQDSLRLPEHAAVGGAGVRTMGPMGRKVAEALGIPGPVAVGVAEAQKATAAKHGAAPRGRSVASVASAAGEATLAMEAAAVAAASAGEVPAKMTAAKAASGTPNRIPMHQVYFGRYGVFALISLLQSTLLGVGNLLFLGIQCEHPALYMLSLWTMGLVFSFTIYTFVVSFGNVGKALGVLLLVMQVSMAGGAYPLQVLPEFFRAASPFLPATHAINAVRAACMGVYRGDYWIDMARLLIFVLPMLLIGLVLRKPLVKFNHAFVATVEKTKLI